MKETKKGKEGLGKVRCLNCFERFEVAPRAEIATCPSCGWEWRISWPNPKLAKIRGPVWEAWEKLQTRGE
jgi:rRNA maturation endonuclease Nob1